MNRRARTSIVANPVLIGAVTVLVITVGVFLAYNANTGLPFVPTTQLKLELPNAARVGVGNEVREGGQRIGQVTEIEAVGLTGGTTGAELTLQIDGGIDALPVDSRVVVRARSVLGLKYLDVQRGTARETFSDGATVTGSDRSLPVEFDDLFDTFEPQTRDDLRTNLTTGGNGFTGRGDDVNLTLAELPGLLDKAVPVFENLADPETGLRDTVRALTQAMSVLRPVAPTLVNGLARTADTFDALTREEGALDRTIAESPATLRTADVALPRIRPALRRLADISDEVRATAREVRRSSGPIDAALDEGRRTLPNVRPFAEDLDGTLAATESLARDPTTDLGLDALSGALSTLTPTLRYVGPHITVCNYWTYFWTFISDALSESDGRTGGLLRVLAKTAPGSLTFFGATSPTQAENVPLPERLVLGDGADLHAQPYGRAVDEAGNADCENGQRGYPTRLAEGAPPDLFGAVDPRTPGTQGPTFKGQPRVPEGQTFSAEPNGTAPKVAG